MFHLIDEAAVSAEPVSLELAKMQRRVYGAEEDDYLNTLISAARTQVESDTGRSLVAREFKQIGVGFPAHNRPVTLLRTEGAAVSKIEYRDEGGALVEWDASNYQWSQYARPAQVCPNENIDYPTTQRGRLEAVTITFTAGYAVDAVPKPLINAMLFLVGHWHQNRETVVTGTIATELPMTYWNSILNYMVRF